jgi:quinoprotein glucose dehydrogenase
MIDRKTREKEIATLSTGNALYIRNCASCHGPERKGNGTVIPSLVDVGKKRTPDEIHNIIKMGNGRMLLFHTCLRMIVNPLSGFY